MNDLLKWVLKTTFLGIFWVFIFSITFNGKPFFNYANNILVQNSLVRMLDDELGSLWGKVVKTAKVTFKEVSDKDKNM